MEYYYNVTTGEVEAGKVSSGLNRMGPYASIEEARAAMERARARNEKWDEDDERWRGTADDAAPPA